MVGEGSFFISLAVRCAARTRRIRSSFCIFIERFSQIDGVYIQQHFFEKDFFISFIDFIAKK